MIDTYQNLIFSVCYKITNHYFDAEDLAQDTFLSAYRNFSSFDGRNEKAWLCRIATNKCLDYKRRAAGRQAEVEDGYFQELADQSQSTEGTCLENFVMDTLSANCRALKPPYDEVAMDYFYHEMTTKQMAEKYGKNEKTIQTQVYRAKAMLRKLYGKE